MIEILLCWLGWSLCLSISLALLAKRHPAWQRWPALYGWVALCSVIPCLPSALKMLLNTLGLPVEPWAAAMIAGLVGYGIDSSWWSWLTVLPQLGVEDDLAPSLRSAHANLTALSPQPNLEQGWLHIAAFVPGVVYSVVVLALLHKGFRQYRLWQRFQQLCQPYPSNGSVWQQLQKDPSLCHSWHDHNLHQLWHDHNLRQLWRKAGSPQVFWHPLPSSPFVAGIRQPRLYLPTWFTELSALQQQLLLRHELQHLIDAHPTKLMLWQIAKVLAWFNPCVGWWASCYQKAIELDVDQHVIRQTGKARSYAELLLLISSKPQHSPAFFTLAASGPQPTKPASQSFHDLQQRLTAMISPASLSRPRQWFMAALLSLTAACIGGFFLLGAAGNAAPPQLLSRQPLLPPWQSGPAQWQHPLPQAYVSSPFGKKSAIRDFKAHRGIDLVAPRGSAIQAIAAGRVLVADASTLKPSLGLTVVIAHKGGYQSLFAHMDRIDVQVGDWVEAGHVIGSLGNSGRTTGPHLHMELALGNNHIDPATIFQGALQGVR